MDPFPYFIVPKPNVVIHESYNQYNSCDNKYPEFDLYKKHTSDDAPQKEKCNDTTPKTDTAEEPLALALFFVEKELRQLYTQIGKQPGKMRGADRRGRNFTYQWILQAHSK